MSRKPRADSVLKTLSEDRRAAIAEHALAHSLDETVAWLAADGIKTSRTALSEFLSWHSLHAQLRRNETVVETMLQGLQSQRPDWTPEQIQAAGQSFFTALALEQQDAEVWTKVQKLQLQKQQLQLDREKFEHLKAQAEKADATERVLDDAQLSPEQRAKRIQEIYGRA